jgi:AraC family transcriptional regulator of adaptative response/methylated-DNA-[protein]-cysteine methyltransferase
MTMTMAPDTTARWAAVEARDARADGEFVFAVATTRVYCRPSCPARRPRREHVTFFDLPDEAAAAGYRACRRCRPDDPRPVGAAEYVARARAFLDRRIAEAPHERVTLTALATAVGVSPHHLQRTFKRATGLTPAEYVRAARAERFREELRRGETVTRAAYGAGFGSGSRVYEGAGALPGMTPGANRRGGRGQRIRYLVLDSPLGRLLVGATERGVCAVALGDDDGALEAELAREYPNAERQRVDGPVPGTNGDGLGSWAAAVLEQLTIPRPSVFVPTDVEGTEFERRVWTALQTIPAGQTRSYREVAAAIGAPNAVRAVASACARNRVALLIPCHRVVRTSGALGGYRLGLDRKRQLLDAESH